MWNVKMMSKGFPAIWIIMFRFLIPVFQMFLCLFKCPTLSFSGTALLASFHLKQESFKCCHHYWGIPLSKVMGIKMWSAYSLRQEVFQTQKPNCQNERQWFLLPVSQHSTGSFVTLLCFWPVWLHSKQRCCNLSLSSRHEGKIKHSVALKFIW